MAILSLTRRKTQLELLARMCDERQGARVVPKGSVQAAEAQTRFLAVQPDGVLMEWPSGEVDETLVSGAEVDVLFTHRGQRYACRTTTRGRASWSCARRGSIVAWKLSPPLRVERHELRRHYRVPLDDLAPIQARFSSVHNPELAFDVRLDDLSVGGLGATAALPQAEHAESGDLFWAEFELPDTRQSCEFVVRVAHASRNEQTDSVALGCTFCPGEDPSGHNARLRRIAQFVAQRERARLRRASSRRGGGG